MAMQAKLRYGILAGLVGGALFAALPALAQSNDAPPPPPPPMAHAGPRKGGGPMAATLADLNLSPDQKKIAIDAQIDSMTRMKALRDDSTLDQKAKRREMMIIRNEEMSKIRAVLTPDQQAKFDVKVADMKEQMRARRAGAAASNSENAAAPSAPPPPPPSQPAPPPQH